MSKSVIIGIVVVVAAIAAVLVFGKDKFFSSSKTRQPAERPTTDTVRPNPSPSPEVTTKTHVVSYTSTGYSPKSLEIKLGDTVTFKNDSTTQMWVASNPHPTHTGLIGFDAKVGAAPGASYSFVFLTQGTFGYHNHLKPGDTGTIIVK